MTEDSSQGGQLLFKQPFQRAKKSPEAIRKKAEGLRLKLVVVDQCSVNSVNCNFFLEIHEELPSFKEALKVLASRCALFC
jgi:hypothetical protein